MNERPRADDILRLLDRKVKKSIIATLPAVVQKYRRAVIEELVDFGVPSARIEYIIGKTGFDKILCDPELCEQQIMDPPREAARTILIISSCDGRPT